MISPRPLRPTASSLSVGINKSACLCRYLLPSMTVMRSLGGYDHPGRTTRDIDILRARRLIRSRLGGIYAHARRAAKGLGPAAMIDQDHICGKRIILQGGW